MLSLLLFFNSIHSASSLPSGFGSSSLIKILSIISGELFVVSVIFIVKESVLDSWLSLTVRVIVYIPISEN